MEEGLPYWVHLSDADRNYLKSLPPSDMAKEKVEDFIEYAIAQVDDDFRNESANRSQPDTRYFRRQLLLFDRWGDRRFHRLDFVISDANAPNGVLVVVYIDHE